MSSQTVATLNTKVKQEWMEINEAVPACVAAVLLS